MKYRFKFFYFFIYIGLLSVFWCSLSRDIDVLPYALRVTKRKKEPFLRYRVFSPRGFTLIDHVNPAHNCRIKKKYIRLTIKKNQIYLDGDKNPYTVLSIVPKVDRIFLNKKKFNGILYVNVSKRRVVVKEKKTRTSSKPRKTKQKNVQPHAVQKISDTQKIATVYQPTRAIRVLLGEWSAKTDGWKLTSSSGFILLNNMQHNKKNVCTHTVLDIQIKKGVIYINNCPVNTQDDIICIPRVGTIGFNNKEYQGTFTIARRGTRVLLVNTLDLEDYLCSVLKSESWPGWPLEVNKVFAIACRSYALATLLQNKKSTMPYDITNTNTHQTYTGVHSNTVIKQAVEQTRGIFLGHDNKPVLAMFDGCCGGIVPAHIEDFDFSCVPYLARDYACTHCKRCKIYSWSVAFDIDQLEELLCAEIQRFAQLKHIKIAQKDKAGLVKEIEIKSNKNGVEALLSISGKKMYSLLKDIKSYCYVVKQRGKKITVDGRGYGHHIGLCQWGAREMVRDGWNYKRILQFYYPNTTFMCLR